MTSVGVASRKADPSDRVAKIRLSDETPRPSTSGWVPKGASCKTSTSGREQRPVTSGGAASAKPDPSDSVAKIRLSDETPRPSTSGWVPKDGKCNGGIGTAKNIKNASVGDPLIDSFMEEDDSFLLEIIANDCKGDSGGGVVRGGEVSGQNGGDDGAGVEWDGDDDIFWQIDC